jgi:putative phosphoesterase
VKIGVISDTHLTRPNRALEHILEELFSETDLILHAGDITSRRVLERLELRGVLAVCGNMDDYDIVDSAPQMRTLDVGSYKIGLIHGWGAREGLEARIIQRFQDVPDVIVYGHSHAPFWGEVLGVRLFNPGSASQNRYLTHPTVGMLEITSEGTEGRILPLVE